MADIHIHRDHTLGLARARRTAEQWAEAAEEKFGLACTIIEAEDHDIVEFERFGVKGRLRVEGDAFDLTAKLGLLAAAFRDSIETEIETNLDAVLAQAGTAPTRAAPPAKAAGAPAKRKRRSTE